MNTSSCSPSHLCGRRARKPVMRAVLATPAEVHERHWWGHTVTSANGDTRETTAGPRRLSHPFAGRNKSAPPRGPRLPIPRRDTWELVKTAIAPRLASRSAGTRDVATIRDVWKAKTARLEPTPSQPRVQRTRSARARKSGLRAAMALNGLAGDCKRGRTVSTSGRALREALISTAFERRGKLTGGGPSAIPRHETGRNRE